MKRKGPAPMIEGTTIRLETPEDIEKWIAERKARWPSAKRIAEKVRTKSRYPLMDRKKRRKQPSKGERCLHGGAKVDEEEVEDWEEDRMIQQLKLKIGAERRSREILIPPDVGEGEVARAPGVDGEARGTERVPGMTLRIELKAQQQHCPVLLLRKVPLLSLQPRAGPGCLAWRTTAQAWRRTRIHRVVSRRAQSHHPT